MTEESTTAPAGSDEGPSDAQHHHPLIDPAGRAALADLLAAEESPVWNHRTGDRLDRGGLARVRSYGARVTTEPPIWSPGSRPDWVADFVGHAAATVPRLRRERSVDAPFTTSRDDLAAAWWDLVPDDAALDELIWFPTSGSGGAPVTVPTHPTAVACYYPLLLAAARLHDVEIRFRSGRVDWITVVDQTQGGYTVPAWSAVLGCATAKVNLNAAAWRSVDHRARFLRRHDPQVLTGDPVSLSALADLDLGIGPRVAISTALRLSPATRSRLENDLGCPVVDVYSTTETGPIAAARPSGGMALLQPELYVEIVDDRGRPVAAGTTGNVAVTGGINPFLPLVRYRTGDTAALEWSGDQPVLTGLAGRSVVTLRGATGPVASMDVVQVLEPLPLRRWSVHQDRDHRVTVAVEPEGVAADDDNLISAVTAAVQRALGPATVRVVALTDPDKVPPFTIEATESETAGTGEAEAGP